MRRELSGVTVKATEDDGVLEDGVLFQSVDVDDFRTWKARRLRCRHCCHDRVTL